MAKKQRERPSVAKVLHTVAQQDFPADAEISRIMVRVLASGDVTYKLFPADGEEYIGGVVNVEP